MLDLDRSTIPWIESPFFQEVLWNKSLNDFEKECALNFNKYGYIKVDLNKHCKDISKIIDQTILDTSRRYGKYDRI
jgi:hypothetical protein